MKRRKFIPPTLQEAEDYVREKNLSVNPKQFIEHYEDAEPPWTDKYGVPLRSWKQKMRTWHGFKLERGGPHRCEHTWCKKPGVYINGSDRDGHPYYYCIDHKPKPKPLPPEVAAIADRALKSVPSVVVDVNAARNKQKDSLGIK